MLCITGGPCGGSQWLEKWSAAQQQAAAATPAQITNPDWPTPAKSGMPTSYYKYVAGITWASGLSSLSRYFAGRPPQANGDFTFMLSEVDVETASGVVVPRVIGMTLGVFSLTVYLILATLASGYLCVFFQNVPLLPGDYFKELADSLSWLDFALLALKTCAFGFFIGVSNLNMHQEAIELRFR